ncbi:MAG: porin [Saprospiraceae bacterium]|nr:porin [Saprospiraceae bacterium]
MRYSFSILLALCSIHAVAQSDSTASPLAFSGYAEVYYAFDFGNPDDHNRPGFVYANNRHNEVALNLGLLKAAYHTEKVRANLGLMAGTYANANLAAEPGVLKNIFEANIGVRLSSSKNLWIDAGIFPAHIGFESAIGKDCPTLTRSMAADNSPYYESGVKISYTSGNGKWFLSALALNGWQRIKTVEGNSLPSFGTQITFKPGANVTLNSSTFVGTDKPDDQRRMRYFHNFYAIFNLGEKLAATAGFDFGAEQTAKGSKEYNYWYSPVLMLKVATSEKMTVAVRGEYYADENGVIIATGSPNGFQVLGISANLDYAVQPNALWRIEGKIYSSKDDIFALGDKPSGQNYLLTTALTLAF